MLLLNNIPDINSHIKVCPSTHLGDMIPGLTPNNDVKCNGLVEEPLSVKYSNMCR
jgi:hypothetical protein